MKMMNQQMKRTRLQTLLVLVMSMMSLTAWAEVGRALYTCLLYTSDAADE